LTSFASLAKLKFWESLSELLPQIKILTVRKGRKKIGGILPGAGDQGNIGDVDLHLSPGLLDNILDLLL
jgi:hypothetical protein